MQQRPRLVDIKTQPGYRLWLRYSDGTEGVADLSNLVGRGVFAAWADPSFFDRAHIDAGGGIAWDDEIDLCPDAIYLQITGMKPEDIFPQLKARLQHASH